MASYYEMSKLSAMLKHQKEGLAKQMTVEEVLNVIKNRATFSPTEVDIALTAGQLIAKELNKYVGDTVNNILESGIEKQISTKDTIQGLPPAKPFLDINFSKNLMDKLFGGSDEKE